MHACMHADGQAGVCVHMCMCACMGLCACAQIMLLNFICNVDIVITNTIIRAET